MQGGVLGYWVDKAHTRRGLATAAVESSRSERSTRAAPARGGTMVENVASQRVLEALGFEQFGLAPELLFLKRRMA